MSSLLSKKLDILYDELYCQVFGEENLTYKAFSLRWENGFIFIVLHNLAYRYYIPFCFKVFVGTSGTLALAYAKASRGFLYLK